jgi:hypothetical protein
VVEETGCWRSDRLITVDEKFQMENEEDGGDWKRMNPCTAIGHSDRKERSLTIIRHNLVTIFCDAFYNSFIQLLFVNSWQK